jgi:hypothetical protein
MYIVSYSKVAAFGVLLGLIAGLFCIVYFEYSRYSELPIVAYTKNDVCIRVVNFKNGDAFNCNDVNVLLRKFRTEYVKG